MEIRKLHGTMNTGYGEILEFLKSFRDELLDRVGSLESRVASLDERCRRLEERSRGCRCCARHCDLADDAPREFRSEVGGRSSHARLGKDGAPYFVHNGSVLLSCLNAHSDYPQGSWLGDDSDPRRRVRVPIDLKVLLNANSTCRSPEKLALKLVDLLFDRETQANGNISGSSKYNKQKLNPVFIYGILCHLVYLFKITSVDWERIKLSIDSKCRSAFRRKRKALEMQRLSTMPAGDSAATVGELSSAKDTGVVPAGCHLSTPNSALGGSAPSNPRLILKRSSLNASGGDSGGLGCPKTAKQGCLELQSPCAAAGVDEPSNCEQPLLHHQTKQEQVLLGSQSQHDPGGHIITSATTGVVVGGGGGGRGGGSVSVSVSADETCPTLLRADSFEFNDLLSDSQADPDNPQEPGTVEDVISLDATVVSDELMSSVSECGGYLEVLQVSSDTMAALQQTHRVQMQPDGTLIAMPLCASTIVTTTPSHTTSDVVCIPNNDSVPTEVGSNNKEVETVDCHKRMSLRHQQQPQLKQ